MKPAVKAVNRYPVGAAGVTAASRYDVRSHSPLVGC